MLKNIVLIILIFSSLLSISIFTNPAFAVTQAVEYLCEFGITFYRHGRYDDALHEFNKVLILDPGNETAKSYINSIFQQEYPSTPQEKLTPPKTIEKSVKRITREEAIGKAFDTVSKNEMVSKKLEKPGLKIQGSTQVSLGIMPDDTIWKQANFDLNEKNYRMLSNTAYDRRTNTFDTRIYDRFRVDLDTDNETGLNFHGNITVDPWSFTGKSEKITLSGTGGDTVELELKYWSNTAYTINETVYTLQNGDSFALPEIKVKDGKIETPVSISSTFSNRFNIPELKIQREFQPVREFWLDYKQDDTKIRFFPIAYQDQALTSDDPLRLSNNHIWWQESPWLDRWQPGRLNSGANPVDFTRGRFNDSLSYFTRDSDGTKLTALRGLSFEYAPDEGLSLISTLASPKGLWQDYDSFDNIINATRLKYRLLDNLGLGALFTYRLGLNENNKRDTANYLWATDLGYELLEGTKLSLEVAASTSQKDLTDPDYKSRSRGNAYHFSLMGTFPKKSIMDLKYGYLDIKPEKYDTFFAKYRFYVAAMDQGFYPALSNYRETRDDTFWSRHIHFRQPLRYYFAGLYKPALSWDDIQPYRIGNGIDIGRNALGFRLETSLLDWDWTLDNLFDVRNVHKTNGKFVENVTRDELTYKLSEKLTTKLLGIYQRLPKTKAGIDPFVFDTKTDIFFNNTAIEDGKNPSLKTGSLGLEYAFNEWVALSGVWERTNDYTLAYDNFPRGVLNSSNFTTFREYDRVFRREDPFLYSQRLFPLPPYPFYNIWKTGLRLEPMENLYIYLDYTRNEFKSSGQIDDNINHIGLEASYTPTKKLGFFFRYTYSRWDDINRMISSSDKIYLGHHNFFTEFRYLPGADDEFVLQYGESGLTPFATITFDPFGGSLSTLDTRHIVRIYYRRKF